MVLHELVRFGSKRFHEVRRFGKKMGLASITLILRRPPEPISKAIATRKDELSSGLEFDLKQPLSGLSVRACLSPVFPIAFWSPV